MKFGAAIEAMEEGMVFAHPEEHGARVTIASKKTTLGIRDTMLGEWVIDRGDGWTMYIVTQADRKYDWLPV